MPSPSETRSKVGGWPLTAAIAVVLAFLFAIRAILLPFILAAAVAFILTPLIDYLTRRFRLRRGLVVAGVYLALFAILGLLLFWVGGLVIRDLAAIARQMPQTVNTLIAEMAHASQRFMGLSIDSDTLSRSVLDQMKNWFGSGAAIEYLGYGVGAIFGTILMLVLLVYFLLSGRRLADGMFWLLPPEYRASVRAVADRILPLLWRYFVGLVAIVIYTSLVAWIGFRPIFHLPHAVLLALVVGLLELVPVIGPALSIALILLTAIEQSSLYSVIGLSLFIVMLRLTIDQLVGPLVLGRATSVHPVVIIFAFLSGAMLFGVIGLLLAVPVAASIKIILAAYYEEPLREESTSMRLPAQPR